MEDTNKQPLHSELRQDIVTGDWVAIATGRAKRASDFAEHVRAPSEDTFDPFENPEASGQLEDVLIYRTPEGEWSLRVIPNKYPILSRGKPARPLAEGPYFGMTGVGYHEVIITRDRHRHIALLDTWQVAEIIDAFQDRYLALMNKKSVNYIQIMHNHGKEAGASIAHPHSQLLAMPVISPYLELELAGAERYYRGNRQYVYQVIAQFEGETKKRVVFENDRFLALCPYASRSAFEMMILGKDKSPYFERISDEEKFALAEALQKALQALYKGLKDPAYNFYVHTAPCDGRAYDHYQWHIEILPHTATWGGLELATGVEVSTIEPERAAEFLREQLKR